MVSNSVGFKLGEVRFKMGQKWCRTPTTSVPQLLLLMGMGGLGIFETWRSWAGLGRAGKVSESEGHGLGGHAVVLFSL